VNDFQLILERIKKNNLINVNLDPLNFENRSISLKNKIQNDESFKNILKGVHIPFVYQILNKTDELGSDLEDYLLPAIQNSFKDSYPNSNFKAILQSNSVLKNNLKIDSNSRYEKFIEKSSISTVVGWYFPQALQEFDVASQRAQMRELPPSCEFNVCLSGAKDVTAAIVGSPELLISGEFYTPILCMSSYVHSDPRLVLLIKSYGPHLEFWCMSQMLTKEITQVSEQWSGGLSIFE
jgi:hypothetical protein